MTKYKHIQNIVNTIGQTEKGCLPTISVSDALRLEQADQLKKIADLLEFGIQIKR